MSNEIQYVKFSGDQDLTAIDQEISINAHKGIFDYWKSSVEFALTVTDETALATAGGINSTRLQYFYDYPRCFERSQCTIHKDNDQIFMTSNLNQLMAFAYDTKYRQDNRKFDSLISTEFSHSRTRDVNSCISNTSTTYYIHYPMCIIFPFLCTDDQTYIHISDTMTFNMVLKSLSGILMLKTGFSKAAANKAFTNLRISLKLAYIPDANIPRQLQSRVRHYDILSKSQQFNFKAKKGRISKLQGLILTNSTFDPATEFSYGILPLDNDATYKTGDDDQAPKIKKNSNLVIDNKRNDAFTNLTAALDLIHQLSGKNPKYGGEISCILQDQTYNQNSINYRVDLSGTTANLRMGAIYQYFEDDETLD